ncbi:MAG: putative heme iron utilization protein [Planctomycetota bacterium]|jgi:putative heme iron utilization protein
MMAWNTTEEATIARRLLRKVDSGVLSSMSQEMPGYPFGSVTPYVLTHDGHAVIYVSAIAQHTANLDGNQNCCLTVMDSGEGNQQALGRATVIGNGVAVPEDRVQEIEERYFGFFPEAREYGQAHSFEFYWIEPKRIRYIGGFGKIYWVECDEWNVPEPEWSAEEAGIISHMNNGHADSLLAIAHAYGYESAEEATMIALDPEGFHMLAGKTVAYVGFDSVCMDTDSVRKALVGLAKAAAISSAAQEGEEGKGCPRMDKAS